MNLDNVEIGGAAKYFILSAPAGKYDNLKLDSIANEGEMKTLTFTTMEEILHNRSASVFVRSLNITH